MKSLKTNFKLNGEIIETEEGVPTKLSEIAIDNLKTINGNSLIGVGDLQILSHDYTISTESVNILIDEEVIPAPTLYAHQIRSMINSILDHHSCAIRVDNGGEPHVYNCTSNVDGDTQKVSYLLDNLAAVTLSITSSTPDDTLATFSYKKLGGSEIQPASENILGGIYFWTDSDGFLHMTTHKEEPEEYTDLSEDYMTAIVMKIMSGEIPFEEEWLEDLEVWFIKDSSLIEGATLITDEDLGDDISAYLKQNIIYIYSPKTIRMFESYIILEDENPSFATIYGNNVEALIPIKRWHLDNFDTSEVESFEGMFSDLGIEAIEEIYGLEHLNTSNATTMRQMFWADDSIVNLDLSNFDISNVTDTSNMFEMCQALENIYVSQNNSDWRNYNITAGDNMFGSCYSLPNFHGDEENLEKAYAGDQGYFTLKN